MLRANLTIASRMLAPFGEIGTIFLYNKHCEHSLLKSKKKKLSPKISVKNIKNRVKCIILAHFKGWPSEHCHIT